MPLSLIEPIFPECQEFAALFGMTVDRPDRYGPMCTLGFGHSGGQAKIDVEGLGDGRYAFSHYFWVDEWQTLQRHLKVSYQEKIYGPDRFDVAAVLESSLKDLLSWTRADLIPQGPLSMWSEISEEDFYKYTIRWPPLKTLP